jgi:hypothetical protein
LQNRYVGDLGDFGKYGLLRALCGSAGSVPQLSLGVVWYLVPDEERTNDGSRIQYLSSSGLGVTVFRNCDPELYDALRKIVANGRRNVKSIRDDHVLPLGTVFFYEPLTFNRLSRNREGRVAYRHRWLERAYKAMTACDVVFLDPDNGFESRVAPHHKSGPKYVFLDEMKEYLKRGQSLVVYHHLGRRGTAKEQLDRQFRRLLALGGGANVFAMLYHRGTARAFFVIEAPAHKPLLLQRANRFRSSLWSQHFDLVDSLHTRSFPD